VEPAVTQEYGKKGMLTNRLGCQFVEAGPMATVTADAPAKTAWITASAAARIWACSEQSVPRIAKLGKVTVRRLPGMTMKYALADVERVAAEAVEAGGRELAARQDPAPRQ
jgi:hypothetical protein